jgi:Ca-activated chloride channel family protein
MTFDWPMMLLLLLLVPLAVVFYGRLQARRQQIAERYGSLGFSQGPAGRKPGRARHIAPILFLVGLTILIISLARPHMEVTLPRIEGTVMLVFDVSGSMAADDLKPSRMEAAKAAAQEFVQRQPSTVQVGVVAFSDGGLAVQAPTGNREAILASIGRLTPQRGTSLGNGILTALQAIASNMGYDFRPQEAPREGSDPAPTETPIEIPPGTFDSSAIILLSDGENHEAPDPLEMAQLAADLGVRIYTVGIGSAAGTILEVEGFSVHTRLDEELLRQIAEISGGAYFNVGNEEELQTIYDNLKLQLVAKPEAMEITSLFAGASVLMLLAGGLFSLLWFSRLP